MHLFAKYLPAGSVRGGVVSATLASVGLAAVNFAAVPLVLRLLGAEAYGLVGVSVIVQACMQSLDLGIGQAVSLQVARFRGRQITKNEMELLAAGGERLFAGIALAAACSLVLFGISSGEEWVDAEKLTPSTIVKCLSLIAISAGLRFLSGAYKALLTGFEKIVELSLLSFVFGIGRTAAVVAWLLWIRASAVDYFTLMVFFILLELVFLRIRATRCVSLGSSRAAGLSEIWRLRKMAGSLALLNLLWLASSQVDRVVFSGVLSLTDFGHFSAVAVLASSLYLITLPAIQAIQPRMARLYAAGTLEEFARLFRRATQLLTVVASAITASLAYHAESALRFWMHDDAAASAWSTTFQVYAVGHAVASVHALAFSAQYSAGRLRLQLWGSVVFTALWVPAALVAGMKGNTMETGGLWMLGNVAFLLVWTPQAIQHATGVHAYRWLLADILLPGGTASAAALLVAALFHSNSEIGLGAHLLLGVLVGLCAGLSVASFTRGYATRWFTSFANP